MRRTKTEQRAVEVLDDVTCDRCGESCAGAHNFNGVIVRGSGAWGDEAERAREVVVEDVPALVAEVRRLTAELSHAGQPRYSGDASVAVDAINAAFNRGVEAMREAAANLATTTARGSEAALYHAECEASGSQWSMGGFMASRIRALKVAP